MLGAGVVLTGGGSLLDGLPDLGERVFQLPVRRGAPIGIGGLLEVVGSPGCATAVGLAIYGASMAEVLVARQEADAGAGLLQRFKRFLTDIF